MCVILILSFVLGSIRYLGYTNNETQSFSIQIFYKQMFNYGEGRIKEEMKDLCRYNLDHPRVLWAPAFTLVFGKFTSLIKVI